MALAVAGCASEAAPVDPARPVVPADPPASASVDPGALTDAVEAWLPGILDADPGDLTPTLDAAAAGFGTCGVAYFDLDGAIYRIWSGDVTCEHGSITGFAQETSVPIAELYDDPTLQGTYAFGYWLANVETDEIHLWGDAYWVVQDALAADGTASRGVYLEGDLFVDEDHAPSWFVDGSAPQLNFGWSVAPDGSVSTAIAYASSPVDDPAVDAISALDLSVTSACDAVSGTVSAHVRNGGWIDLTLTTIDDGCTACGDAVADGGTGLGTICVALDALVEDR
ncbi:MAG: hypothetical protein ABMB14_04045 [Myxococcota bacterium]